MTVKPPPNGHPQTTVKPLSKHRQKNRQITVKSPSKHRQTTVKSALNLRQNSVKPPSNNCQTTLKSPSKHRQTTRPQRIVTAQFSYPASSKSNQCEFYNKVVVMYALIYLSSKLAKCQVQSLSNYRQATAKPLSTHHQKPANYHQILWIQRQITV